MRVTLVGRDFPPRLGGIADHTDRLADALAQRGHTVSVVCEPPADARESFAVIATSPEDASEAILATDPDAILWQYNPFSEGRYGLAARAGARAKALASIAPLTVFFHELWFPWGRDGARGAVWAAAQRVQANRVLRESTSWIVTTPPREQALRRRNARKTHRIPVGTNIDPISASKEKAREQLGIEADAFVVAHLGSTGPGRDLQPVVDAARKADAIVYLAGDTGPDRPRGPHVRAPGRESPDRLSLALRAADLYAHADPVGASAGRRTTLVAALAHGLPIVAYRGPDRAPDLDGAIVEVGRTAVDVADALIALRDDPARRERLGAEAARIFQNHYAWGRIAEGVEAVLLGR